MRQSVFGGGFRFRRLLLTVHLWIGIGFAIPFAMLGLTAVAIVLSRALIRKRPAAYPVAMLLTVIGLVLTGVALLAQWHRFRLEGPYQALAGMIAAPMALMLLLAWGLNEASGLPHAHGLIRGALGGIAAVAAGQIIGTVLKLSAPLRDHELGWPACLGLAALALALVVHWHWPLVHVLLGLGGLACLACYGLLQRRARQQATSQSPQEPRG